MPDPAKRPENTNDFDNLRSAQRTDAANRWLRDESNTTFFASSQRMGSSYQDNEILYGGSIEQERYEFGEIFHKKNIHNIKRRYIMGIMHMRVLGMICVIAIFTK